MSVTIETTEGLGRKVELKVAKDSIVSSYNSELKKVAKNAKIDGFRKGKVPANMIAQRYGAGVLQEVLSEQMRNAFLKVLIEQKINMAGAPTFDPQQYSFGEDLTFTALFEVYPQIVLKDLENISVEKPITEVTDSDLDKMLEVLRKQQATFRATNDGAALDARVTIDFAGSIDGAVFDGGSAQDFVLVMGQGQMIPGFEEGIVGKKAGDQFELALTFPENYKEELKGKNVVFNIKVKKVEEQLLPELNDEFVKKFGSKTKTLDDLKAEIKTNMVREIKNAIAFRMKTQVVDGLLTTNGDFAVPKVALAEEISKEKERAVQRFGGNKEILNNLPDELFVEAATRSLKVGLLLSQVVSDYKLQADEQRVSDKIAEIASAYEDPQEVIAHYNSKAELKRNIALQVLEQMAVDAVVSQAKVTEVIQSFDEVMASVRS